MGDFKYLIAASVFLVSAVVFELLGRQSDSGSTGRFVFEKILSRPCGFAFFVMLGIFLYHIAT